MNVSASQVLILSPFLESIFTIKIVRAPRTFTAITYGRLVLCAEPSSFSQGKNGSLRELTGACQLPVCLNAHCHPPRGCVETSIQHVCTESKQNTAQMTFSQVRAFWKRAI